MMANKSARPGPNPGDAFAARSGVEGDSMDSEKKSGSNAFADQPIYMVRDRLVYMVDGVQFWASPRCIYESLQIETTVGPHMFAHGTTVLAGRTPGLDWDDVDPDDLPVPNAVHGEVIDAVTAVSEWMDWCDQVMVVSAASIAEAKSRGFKHTGHLVVDHTTVAMSEVWAVAEQAALDRVHRELAAEEVVEAMSTMDAPQMRRLRSFALASVSARMAAAQ